MKSKAIVKAIPDIFTFKPRRDFDPRNGLPGFETFKNAAKRRKSIIRFLEKYYPENEHLVTALQACKKGWRCALLACPICMRRTRIWICDQIVPLVCNSPGEWMAVSLVARQFRSPAGSLHRFHPQHLISALRRVLKPLLKNKSLIAFGGIDYCAEVIREYHWCPTRTKSYEFRFYWVPHVYILIKMPPGDRPIMDSCLDEFSQSAFVSRPTYIKSISHTRADALRVTTYALKSHFYARHKTDALHSSRKSKRPKKQRLHGMCEAELAVCLASHALKDRMILVGMKRHQKTIMITNRNWRKNGPI